MINNSEISKVTTPRKSTVVRTIDDKKEQEQIGTMEDNTMPKCPVLSSKLSRHHGKSSPDGLHSNGFATMVLWRVTIDSKLETVSVLGIVVR